MAQFNKPNIQGLQDYLSNSSNRGENPTSVGFSWYDRIDCLLSLHYV